MVEKQKAAEVPCFVRDGGKMPVIGFGTFQLSGQNCRDAVEYALNIGYRHVDTARMYENEQEVGQGIRNSGLGRDEIFLTTKLQRGQLEPEGVRASCEKSLKELNTDYVDLLLIHWPETSVPLADTLGTMEALKREGKTRHVGVSNFTLEWMDRAIIYSDGPIFCNQLEYHPYLCQDQPMGLCRKHGIGIVAYSPLARGRVLEDDRLTKIGRRHGKTPAQVALRWLLQQPDVVAIPKGSSKEHIRQNFDILDFKLDAEEMAEIDRFDKGQRLIDPDWAPEWDF